MIDSDRLEKIILWTLGTVEKLVLMGLVERNNAPQLSPEGMKTFEILKASGFSADKDEIAIAVTLFRQWEAQEEQADDADLTTDSSNL